jgi:hypothetical protein
MLTERSSGRFLMEKLKHGKHAMPTTKAAWRMLLSQGRRTEDHRI